VKGRGRKRFFKQSEVTGEGPYGIALDGRALKTPGKRNLEVPSLALAEAIAAEWAGQGDRIQPERMWLTKLANTAIDHVEGEEAKIIADIVNYVGSDLLCYRAAEPENLVIRQGEYWDPVLSWAEETLGVRFITVQGITHQAQPRETLDAVESYLHRFNAMELCVLHNLSTLTGSALLTLSIASGWLEPERAWLIAHVDEDWQAERWGEVREAVDRRARRKQEFEAAVQFLELLGPLGQRIV
jgi:chaperone required for assembly of F1-ATPase